MSKLEALPPIPWRYDAEREGGDWGRVVAANDRPIAFAGRSIPEHVAHVHRCAGTDPFEAIARAIAALPMMITFLEGMVREHRDVILNRSRQFAPRQQQEARARGCRCRHCQQAMVILSHLKEKATWLG
jgi:hypothetical protein